MGHPNSLTVEARRGIYGLALLIYETFEALPERGILVQDIESSMNKSIKLAAAYSVSDSKPKILKDILAELKGLKALLGIVRDTNVLERQPALKLLDEVLRLDEMFASFDRVAGEVEVAPVAIGLVPELQKKDKGHIQRPDVATRPYQAAELKTEKAREYRVIEDFVSKTESAGGVITGGQIFTKNRTPDSTSVRQNAIIEVLKRRPRVSVGELDTLFSQKVSKKTLQRDLQGLIDRGLVQREGDKRWAMYFLVQR